MVGFAQLRDLLGFSKRLAELAQSIEITEYYSTNSLTQAVRVSLTARAQSSLCSGTAGALHRSHARSHVLHMQDRATLASKLPPSFLKPPLKRELRLP